MRRFERSRTAVTICTAYDVMFLNPYSIPPYHKDLHSNHALYCSDMQVEVVTAQIGRKSSRILVLKYYHSCSTRLDCSNKVALDKEGFQNLSHQITTLTGRHEMIG